MVKVGIFLRVVAKPGKETQVAEFLASALALAEAEPTTTAWFAIKLKPNEFGVFDVFPNDAGRQTHLDGPIAQALMARAGELFAQPPSLEKVDVLAAKL